MERTRLLTLLIIHIRDVTAIIRPQLTRIIILVCAQIVMQSRTLLIDAIALGIVIRFTIFEVDVIRKIKGGYKVVSESGKNMGKYKTRAEAQKRLRQIEYFKHVKK